MRMPHSPTLSALPRHLLGIHGLTETQIRTILASAQTYIARNRATDKKHRILQGRTLINLFFENSTRTRTSFELAGKRLGMDVINISASVSSISKGETIIDTAMTLDAMQADAIVVRHPQSGALALIAEHLASSKVALINAGDGSHEHPTQALLDALTILQHHPDIAGLNVAICGDIAHSRVARSNMLLLTALGANVTVIAPPVLMPVGIESLGVRTTSDMKMGLKDADVVMMLRIQNERLESKSIASVRDYFSRYGLDKAKLALARPNALVMHPGPINRGVEIDSTIADDIERSVILQQVEMGVALRQAILELFIPTA
jgi:aspartate carbamoyltransferase catalytic subunit